MAITKEKVDNGDFPLLHCDDCDWPWRIHGTTITSHEFKFPYDLCPDCGDMFKTEQPNYHDRCKRIGE